MKHPLLSQIIHNMYRAGITMGVVMDVDEESGKVTIGSLTEELIQFNLSIFPSGVSRQDRVIVTRCYIYGTVHGAILPPGWNVA